MDNSMVQTNWKLLKSYPYQIGFFNEIMPRPEDYTKREVAQISVSELYENAKLFVLNMVDVDCILEIEKKTVKNNFFSWKKMPLYLFFDNEGAMYRLLQNEKFNDLLACGRIVFIYKRESLDLYFEDYQTVLPEVFVGDEDNYYTEYFDSLKQKRQQHLLGLRNDINDYYVTHASQVIENIKRKKYKVLFLCTRFIGYTIVSDMYEGSIKAGYDAEIAIEKNDISRIYYEVDIARVKPDIIFMANSFRFERDFLPKQVVVASWLIDYRFKNMANSEVVKKISTRDVLCCTTRSDDAFFEKYNYNLDEFVTLPFNVVNDRVFKKYSSNELNLKNRCDVAYVSSNSDYKRMVQDLYKEYEINLLEAMKSIADEYCVLEKSEQTIYDFNQVRIYLREKLKEREVTLSEELFEEVYLKFLTVRYSIRKYVLGLWLIEQERYDIKFYGLNWATMEEFQKYNGGFPKAGEEVSKVYNTSKIVIATQPDGTFPIKVTEVLMSGSLPIVEKFPPQHDLFPLGEGMEMDKDIVGYSGKAELYEKLDYYLEHEEEREEIIARGREKVKYFAPENQIGNVFNEIERRACNNLL